MERKLGVGAIGGENSQGKAKLTQRGQGVGFAPIRGARGSAQGRSGWL